MTRRTTSTPAPSNSPTVVTSTAGPATRSIATAERRGRIRTRRLRLAGSGAAVVAAGLVCTGVVASAAGASPALGIGALGDSIGVTASPSSTTAPLGSGVTVTPTAGDRVSVHAGSAVPRATANSVAALTIASGERVEKAAAGKVSAASLSAHLDTLAEYRTLDPDVVMERVSATTTVTTATQSAMKKAAAKAASAKAQAAAEAKADAARLAAANTPDGAKATARALMASQYGWGDDQFQCLVSLWTKESGWNYQAYNASGATGIPQALPGSKMASVSSDWATNATTQIIWGLGYISGSYGTPCAAWAHSVANNWY